MQDLNGVKIEKLERESEISEKDKRRSNKIDYLKIPIIRKFSI
jgi:hypothetical protein